jgi:hypothetical protein
LGKEDALRRFCVLLSIAVLPLVLPAQAEAHHLIVSPPGQDQPVHGPGEHWVGGFTLPDAVAGAPGLFFSPVLGFLPAAHGNGLVKACLATRAHGNEVVSFAPPPLGTADVNCQHGPP